MNPLNLDDQIVRNPDMLATDMDGEIVMLSIEQGEYFGIGGVGTLVWELLDEPVSIGALCDVICSKFDVDEARCQADMLSFVNEMVQNKAVFLQKAVSNA